VETRHFFEFLKSAEAGEVFARYGFIPLLKNP
jgi:accessory colonization factor AcfC